MDVEIGRDLTVEGLRIGRELERLGARHASRFQIWGSLPHCDEYPAHCSNTILAARPWTSNLHGGLLGNSTLSRDQVNQG